jgi:head-tail adaptor
LEYSAYGDLSKLHRCRIGLRSADVAAVLVAAIRCMIIRHAFASSIGGKRLEARVWIRGGHVADFAACCRIAVDRVLVSVDRIFIDEDLLRGVAVQTG